MRGRPKKDRRRARPTIEHLIRRTLLSTTMVPDAVVAGKWIVTFGEDVAGAADQLTLRNSSGQLVYSWDSVAFTSDLDTAVPGTQSLPISQISEIRVGLGSGDDSLTIDSVTGPVAPSPRGIAFDGVSGTDLVAAVGNTDYTLTGTSLAIGGGATVGLMGVEQAVLTGGNSGNRIDALAFGGPTTLNGGNGNDTVLGGSGNDLVDGGQGSESLLGNAGNDTIIGGTAGSHLDGGAGDDWLIGGNGKDSLFGRAGDDVLFGSNGADLLDGGDGNDRLSGGSGNDALLGGAGVDRVVESADVDWTLSNNALTGQGYGTDFLTEIEEAELLGGPSSRTTDASAFTGSTTLDGGGGSDTLIGGTGSNRFVWSPSGTVTMIANGVDSVGFLKATTQISLDLRIASGTPQIVNAQGDAVALIGTFENVIGGNFGNHLIGDGSTTLTGGAGDDTIEAGAGDTTVLGNGGADLLYGGTGSDSIVAGGGNTGTTIVGGGGRDLLYGGTGNDSIVSGGGTSTGAGSTVVGGGGRDLLYGGTGSDSIVAGPGTSTGAGSTIIGGGGGDLLYGGTGSDSIVAGGGTTGGGGATIVGGGGRDLLYGGTGSDSIVAGPGTPGGGGSTIVGGGGRDLLYGGTGNDSIVSGGGGSTSPGTTLRGGGGGDILFGGAGGEYLEGEDGDDIIYGGSGNNVILGGAGNDVIYGNVGNDSIDAGDGNDLAYGQAGDDTITGGNDNDTLIGGTGNDSAAGGAGSDSYLFPGIDLGSDVIDEASDADQDGLDFSTLGGAIVVDLASTATQVVSSGNLTLRLTSGSGIEDVTGTAFADDIRGNTRSNRLAGTDALDDRGGVAAPWNGRTQVVYLDFDSETGAGEHVYTTAERQAIQSRIADDYALFHFSFTLSVPVDVPAYVTIFFNKTPVDDEGIPLPGAGGQSDEFDFRNLNLGGTAAIDVNALLGGEFEPAASSENFVAISATIGAHELGHLVGLRHADSFGPIGSGIHTPPGPDATRPAYPGPSGAFETTFHLMATPDSVGSSLDDAVGDPFFGEREAIKLAVGDSGVIVPEQSLPHRTRATAQPLDLSRLSVPNTLKRGFSALKDFAVAAATVTASIVIDPATSFSESDYYSIVGRAGDLLNFEVFSTTLNRYASNPIDSILRLYDSAGNLVNYYGSVAVNDDGFEENQDAILFDLRLPANGTYYLEVDTFTDSSVPDTETGFYELLAYRFDAGVGNDGSDNLVGREGNDQLVGGLGDDTLDSGAGSDILDSGLGNDTLLVLPGGADVVTDSGGRDTLNFSGATAGVSVNLGLAAGQVQTINSTGGTLALTGSVDVVIGSGFNDLFNASTSPVSVVLFGGAGADSLTGGQGNDVLIGGDGNDVLTGNNGRDVMVGGNGSDRLDGGDGDDLLIGGRTTFDQNLIALDAILAEWTSSATYDNRVDHLIGALAGGANGAFLLVKGVTVLDDGVSDTLTGGLGMDVFFAFPQDSNDKKAGERKL